MMPSVGTRRSTRVFGTRVLRSGRRLLLAPVERKHVRRSEAVSNSEKWIELLDNSGGDCRSEEDAISCLRNGRRRDVHVMQGINVDGGDEKSEEFKPSLEDANNSLICNNFNSDKMWGTVYHRKRRKNNSACTSFDGGHRKKRATESTKSTWRKEGIVSLRSSKATCNFLGSGRLRVLAIVTEPGSSNGSYWVSCLLNMVLRYMTKTKVRLHQLADFMLSNPLNQNFLIHGIHLSKDSNWIGRPRVCQLYGARCFIPLFTLYFSGIPSCFLSLHFSMQLKYVCHLHDMTRSVEEENSFEGSDDSFPGDLNVTTCLTPSNSDSAVIEIKRIGSELSRKKRVTTSSTSRRSCRILHPRNGVNSRSNIRKRTFRPRRVKNTLSFGVYRGNLCRSKQIVKPLASITLKTEVSVQKKSASTSSVKLTRDMDTTFCFVNVLVVEHDRCYRITEATVKLEELSTSSKHWFLAVRKDDVLKYSLVAHRVMRPCSNNRVTHDIIWSADNNRWKLEFPKRQDWFIFKELYRECSQRNLMEPVSSVISVPGVKDITGYIDSGEDIAFVRPESYITLKDDELSRTLAKKTAIYDMDSDDEEWLDEFNRVSSGTSEMNKALLHDRFELIIDALEKSSFCNPFDQFGENPPPDLCLDLGEKEVVESVCNYWMSKRKKKRSPLIKVYQCYQPRKSEVLLPIGILRKKRSFKRKPSQSSRGKHRFFMKAHKVIVLYDGEWKIVDGVSSFVSNASRGVTIPQNTTYAELVDIIYKVINVDKFRYDLVLKVKYNMLGIQNSPPVVIKRDVDVVFYLKETSNSLQHRTPLCVSLVEKSVLTNLTLESKIPRVVPEIDDTDVFPMFQQDVFESQNDILVNQAEKGPCLRPNEGVSDDWVASIGVASAPGEPITSHCRKTSIQYERCGMLRIPVTLQENTNSIGLEVGTLFENKKGLQLRLYKYAMANHFEFKVEKSRKELWYVKCLDEKCKWRLRAVKKKFSEMFEIRKFVQEHTCPILTRQEDKRQAPSWVIGECMKGNLMDYHHDHMPKKIIEDIQRSYGIRMSYNKAWRSREKALMAMRGTVEDSYSKLPSYLYMLEKNNPGTITDIQTDELGQFRYMFMSLGVSIRGFISSCRPVLCVDASFLNHKVGGQLLVAIALDANEQLYPVAFGVVDSENNDSWTYFMQKLRETIGSVPNLVFVSDRHPSIVNALSTIFPEADHGACTYHLKMNIMAKFKTNSCHAEFDMASCAYTMSNFNQHFDNIRAKDPRIAAYLKEIGLERWSRAFFTDTRYNQLTSNYAKSFNSQSKNARKYPITTLVDYLRSTVQEWFYNRREKAAKHTERLSQYYEKFLREQAEKGRFYNVHPLNQFHFYVHDGESDFNVDFKGMTCSCRVFDVSGLPCTHALAAARIQKLDVYDFCSRYYSTDLWLNAYAETCYPVCNEDNWDIPENIKQRVCLKPSIEVNKGRLITKCRSSQGESRKVRRRCSSCGGQGHNKATCSIVMSIPSTARASSRIQSLA